MFIKPSNRSSLLLLSSLLIISIVMLAQVGVKTAQASVPAGESEYFVPGSADQLFKILQNNDDSPMLGNAFSYAGDTCATGGVDPGGNGGIAGGCNYLHNVVTVSVSSNNVTVYYDQWENGYQTGPTGDEVYHVNKGDILTFESDHIQIPRSTSAQCTSTSKKNGVATGVTPTNCYDGRDRIYVVGGAVSVAQAFWPEAASTVYANAWEIYPIKPEQTQYVIPVGIDLYASNTTTYHDFQHVYVLVEATTDNTTVNITDPTGSPTFTQVTLNRGEVTQLYGIHVGTKVTTSKPSQVQFVVGYANSGQSSDSRSYTAVPSTLWNSAYIDPVPSASGTVHTDIFLYNPNSYAISVNYTDASGSGTISNIPAGTTVSYYSQTGRYVPNTSNTIKSGVYLEAADGNSKFWAIGSYDAHSANYNWGFSLIPTNLLTPEYYVSWAPGNDTVGSGSVSGVNASPIYVSPLNNNTTIYVDYPPIDGVVNATYVLNRSQSVELFNSAASLDNTGMHVWANGPIAMMWGEDATVASQATPYIDAGYTILPLNKAWINVEATLAKSASPTTITNTSGQTVWFDLLVSSGTSALSRIDVYDTLPANFGYVSGNTTITLPDNSTITDSQANPSVSGQVLTWSNVGNIAGKPGMAANQTVLVHFQAITTAIPFAAPAGGDAFNIGAVDATVGSTTITATDNALVTVKPTVDLTAVKSNDVGGEILAGGTFNWNILVKNRGTQNTVTFTQNQTILTDNLPTSNATYGTPVVTQSGTSGNINCTISANTLTCAVPNVAGNTFVIPPEKSFNVRIPVTNSPAAATILSNPAGAGICRVDPNSVITEDYENNNDCADAVTVYQPDLAAYKSNDTGGSVIAGNTFNWTINISSNLVQNFTSGWRLLVDNLPTTATYPGPVTVKTDPGTTGTINCSITSNTLTCTAGTAVSLAASDTTFSVTFPVIPGTAGNLTNPAGGGACQVDPDLHISESNRTNNNCTDTVSVVAAIPTISKGFLPGTTSAGSTTTLEFIIANPSATQAQTHVSFSDTFPTTPGAMKVASSPNASTNGCGTPTFNPSAGAASISFSNGTIAAGGTCTVFVNVTAPAAGSYSNTSGAVQADSGTGNTASASLQVTSGPPTQCGLVLATWNFNSNGDSLTAPTASVTNVTASASVNGLGTGSWQTGNGSTPTYAWGYTGWPNAINTGRYYQFNLDTRGYTSISATFDARNYSNNGPTRLSLYSSGDSYAGANNGSPYTISNGWTSFSTTLSGSEAINNSASAAVRFIAYSASNTNLNFALDNLSFTGCKTIQPPSIVKSFASSPIQNTNYTTLSFTLSNPNTFTSLEGVGFNDSYPSGLVNKTPLNYTNTCNGAVNVTAGGGSLSLAGGSIATGGACTVSVDVTGPYGTFNNTSGSVFSTNGGTGGTASASLVIVGIDAVNDSGSRVNGANGGQSLANVLVNDTLNGAAATTANVNLTFVSSTNPGVTLNTTTSAVNVAAGTPSGNYTLTYQICDKANPSFCDQATVTVPVTAIDAVNDSGNRVNGTIGGQSLANVLTNDTLNGAAATLPTVNLSFISSTNPGVTMDTSSGTVNVAAGTASGNYSLTYQICDKVNPTICDQATVTVPVTAIDAVNDSGSRVNGANGGQSLANVLANDTLNGSTATLSTVNLTSVSSTNPGVTLDTSTGAVNVAAGTASGNYTLTYQICDKANPTICDQATVTVPVTAIDARNDNGAAVNGTSGGSSIGNVLTNNGNGADLLNSSPATLSTVTISPVGTWPTGISLNPSTGEVTVAPGTAPGTYTPQYQICDKTYTSICDIATVTVPVMTIDAINDNGSTINGAVGGSSIGNVLNNNGNGTDLLNGSPATLSTVTISPVGTWPTGISLNPSTGEVTVAAGTAYGTYTPQYQICDKTYTTVCDTATVTVPVVVIDAVNDTGTTVYSQTGGQSYPNVLVNDTLNGAGATLSNVNLSFVSSTNPGVTLDTSTGAVNVAPGTPAGNYTLDYQICDKAHPTFCDTATVTVPVIAYRSIGDTVWNDANGNGLQDVGETVLGGVRVFVDSNSNGSYDAGEPTAITDGNGNYTIGSLAAGSYSVRVDPSTLPAGYVDSYDLDGTGTPNVTALTLTAGENRTEVDFGYYDVPKNFGHLPSSYLNMNLLADGGAWSVTGTSYLGYSVTTALDGINTVTYTPKASDDGVIFTPGSIWSVASGGSVNVTVHCADSPCYLNAWFDWNKNCNLNDPGDQIFNNLMVNDGTQTLTFSIPSGTSLSGLFYSRFRLTTQPAANPQPNGVLVNGDGVALVGEIEDPYFDLTGGGPTPVTVAYFLATRNGNTVTFNWSTATETNNVGFNLYVKASGKVTLINTQLIPSKVINSLDRQDYIYTVNVTGSNFYIEDVSVEGTTERFGPYALGKTYGQQLTAEQVNQAAIQTELNANYAQQQSALQQQMNVPAAAFTTSNQAAPTSTAAVKKAGSFTGQAATATRTPKPTLGPTATKTPKPTLTSSPTKTPKPTLTSSLTKTPKPTAKPKVSSTPIPPVVPAATYTPVNTDVPPTMTDTPVPPSVDQPQVVTDTPVPSATDLPSATVTDTPVPTATDVPTDTFTPTLEPSATFTATLELTATQQPTPTDLPPANPVTVDPSSLQLTTTLNFQVRQTGLYRVTYEMLKAAGLDLAGVPVTNITVINRDQMVPVRVQAADLSGNFGPGGILEFYGQALDTLYTDTNIYKLQISLAIVPQIPPSNAIPDLSLTPVPSFTDTVKVNNQLNFDDASPADDPWYDTSMMVFTTGQSWSFPFQVTGLADASAPASLKLVVWGGSSLSQKPDHHILVAVNGKQVGVDSFDGMISRTIDINLPAGTLVEGTNTLQLTLPADTGASYDILYLDKFNVSYQRTFQAQNGKLTFNAAGSLFSVTNLPNANVEVYRMSSKGIAMLNNVSVQAAGSTYTASFAGSSTMDTYLVSTTDVLYAPTLQAVRATVNLNQPAQYLIISHPNFISGLKALVTARQAQGLTVSVVDVNDLYAQYTYGIFDPQAIQKYIAYAVKNLGTKYVLLVGGDTYDYRNYTGKNSVSFIPSLYADLSQDSTFIPSDPLYADGNGDGVPDVAIGRFPVRTATDLSTIINKTLVYATKTYGKTSLFASDVFDGAVSYKNVSSSLAAGLPSSWKVTADPIDDLGINTARTNLLAAMNSGTALINFNGHSSPLQWTFNNLFTTKDATTLTNTNKPFVVVQWGCWNTYYVDPVNNFLVQKFLFSGNRGAAAVLGATATTDAQSEQLLAQLVLPKMVQPGMSIGQAVQDAKAQLARTHPEISDIILGWTLMGDPALMIQP